jgi:hypothetical protein
VDPLPDLTAAGMALCVETGADLPIVG